VQQERKSLDLELRGVTVNPEQNIDEIAERVVGEMRQIIPSLAVIFAVSDTDRRLIEAIADRFENLGIRSIVFSTKI